MFHVSEIDYISLKPSGITLNLFSHTAMSHFDEYLVSFLSYKIHDNRLLYEDERHM